MTRVLIAVIAVGTGCGGGRSVSSPAAQPAAPAEALVREAAELYRLRCTPCHGAGGRGDGPSAETLEPKPRDFSLASWHASITDQRIERAIVGGGIAIGMSPVMPSNPDLSGRPDLLAAVRRHLRGFRQETNDAH